MEESKNILDNIEDTWPGIKFISYGLFRAWLFITYNTTIFSTLGNAPIEPATMQLATTPAIAFIGLMLALSQNRPAESKALSNRCGWILASLAALGLASTLVSPLLGGIALASLGMIASGIGVGWMTVRCGLLFITMPTRSIFVYSAAGEALAYLLYFLIVGMPPALGMLAFALLPLATMFCLSLGSRTKHADNANPHGMGIGFVFPKRSFLRFLIVLALLSLAGALSREFLISSRPASDLSFISSIRMGSAFFIAMGILAFSLFSRKRVSFLPLYYLLVVAIIAILMCMPFLNETLSYGSVALSVLFLPFKLLAWCMFCGFARYWNNYALRILGFSSFAMESGTVTGWCASALMVAMQPDTYTQLIVSLVFILFLVILAFIVFGERDMRSLNGRDAENEPSHFVTPNATENKNDWETLMTNRFCLSRREREVFTYLVRGRDTPFIAERLFISSNTVKTHIRNIYAKVGVRTRQELLDTVEEYRKNA